MDSKTEEYGSKITARLSGSFTTSINQTIPMVSPNPYRVSIAFGNPYNAGYWVSNDPHFTGAQGFWINPFTSPLQFWARDWGELVWGPWFAYGQANYAWQVLEATVEEAYEEVNPLIQELENGPNTKGNDKGTLAELEQVLIGFADCLRGMRESGKSGNPRIGNSQTKLRRS